MILSPGINCKDIKMAREFSILIDGDDYYHAFFSSARKAKKSINILGWEFDSRIHIGHINKLFPNDLRNFFERLVELNKNLQINILSWKSSSYLRFDRERMAGAKWWLKTNENIHFKETRHPFIYGTYHEKMAIIDESCAFIGGIDITRKRWDTPDHRIDNPLRVDFNGKCYYPIHDIQVICTGAFVDDLSTYLRNRNVRVASEVGERRDVWPQIKDPIIKNVEVALSRTDYSRGKFEIEKLYEEAIMRARDFIYIENQYFTHMDLVDKICSRLKEENGPEVIIILPCSYRGYFEKAIYSNERRKAFERLKRADIYGRLAFMYPHTRNDWKKNYIIVHSKLLIVDNRFLTLGSANLNYRSMRVDNEVNVSMESNGDDEVQDFITLNMMRLLAEHLNVSVEEIKDVFEKTGSLLKVVKEFQGKKEKTLKEIQFYPKEGIDHLLILLTPMVDIKVGLRRSHVMIVILSLLYMSFIYLKGF